LQTSSFNIKLHWFLLVGIIAGMLPVLGFAIGIPELSLIPVALIIVWLAITYPFYFVVLIAALVPLSIQIDDVGGGLGLSLPTEPMMIFFFALLFLRFMLFPKVALSFVKQPIVAFVIFYIVWYFITTLTSSMPLVSIKSFIARFWFISIFFFFLIGNLWEQKQIKTILFAMLASSMIMVTYTLFRHSAEGFVRLHSYTIMRPFFNDHGIYAAYIAFFVPILTVFSLFGKDFKINKFWRLVLGGMAVWFLIGILFSYTRATWLSIVAMIVFGLLVRYGITFKQMFIAIILAIMVFMWQSEKILYELSHNKQDSAEQLEDHIKSVSNISTDPSNLERINRWKSAVEMAKAKPILGFGPYTYTFQYAPFQRPQDLTLISTHAGTLGNAHSEYFMALAEMGIPGLLILMGLFLSCIYIGIKLYRTADENWVRNMAIAITLGLFTYFIHGLLNNYTEYDKIAVPMWSFMAILVALDLYQKKISKT
jgi:putative inorganic carbon (HCO3(-)) transporter